MNAPGKSKQDDQYSEEKAQRRFMGTLRAALNTPPKPMISPKKKKAKRAKVAKKLSKPK
jgi:hypothetical protein